MVSVNLILLGPLWKTLYRTPQWSHSKLLTNKTEKIEDMKTNLSFRHFISESDTNIDNNSLLWRTVMKNYFDRGLPW